MKPNTAPNTVQGEGDYKSAKRYDESVQSFVKAGKVPDAALKAKPANPQEAKDFENAEKIGFSHSKGEDPGVVRKARGKP